MMIELKEITCENFWKVVELRPNESQREYLHSNAVFMAQAYVNLKFRYPDACFALYSGSHIVGFTKVVYVPRCAGPYNFSEDTYMIDAFMIDGREQGKGYGKAGFQQVLAFIETKPWGESNTIKLACHDSNTVAVSMYRKAGFCETDQFVDRDKRLRIYSKTIGN